MPLDTPARDLVQQLRQVGLRPTERLVGHILEYGMAAREPLLELATEVTLLEEEEPNCWGPLHALRLLGEMPDLAMIEPLLRTLPIQLYEDVGPERFWFDDLLQMLARCGAEASPLLWAWADEQSHHPASRGAAIQAQTYLIVVVPELRETIIAETRRRLEQEQDPVIAAYLVNMLAGLAFKEAYNEVMAAYRSGRVNQAILPAASARQLLLSNQPHTLDYVQQSLWERYDKQGPLPDNEE